MRIECGTFMPIPTLFEGYFPSLAFGWEPLLCVRCSRLWRCQRQLLCIRLSFGAQPSRLYIAFVSANIVCLQLRQKERKALEDQGEEAKDMPVLAMGEGAAIPTLRRMFRYSPRTQTRARRACDTGCRPSMPLVR